MLLPSKELLSEVLQKEYSDRLVERIEINDNLLQIFYTCSSKGIATCLGIEINIYELAHKCKEWALCRNKCLSSTPYCKGLYVCTILGDDMFEAETEPEAIFKACEWLLELKETK